MREREIVSIVELDKAAVSQVFSSHHTDSAMIDTILSNLKSISAKESLLDGLYPWIEYTSSSAHHEDFLKREASRPIGYSGKIRVGLAFANDQEADLVIAANQEAVTFQDVLNVYKFITGECPTFALTKTAKAKVDAPITPAWGVPGWRETAVFAQAVHVHLTELDSEHFSTFGLNTIASALLITLAQYGSKHCRIFMEENDFETKKLKTGVLEDRQTISIEEGMATGDGLLHGFEAGIIVTRLPELQVRYSPSLSSPFPVTISVAHHNGVLQSIVVSASEKCVHPVVLGQFVDLFHFYLEFIAENPNFSTADLLQMSPPQERLGNTSSTGRTGSISSISSTGSSKGNQISTSESGVDLLERIQWVAHRFPDRLAVSDHADRITYSELNRKSDVIAKRLRSYGIQEGDFVVVSLDQTVELIVVLVAIMKAGGTYIPVDPNYPMERISFVIEDSGAAFLITNLQEIPSKQGITVIPPSRLTAEVTKDQQEQQLDSTPLPTHAPSHAYVIYTSGTSGQPKGVLVPSKNIVSLIDGTKQEFKLTEHEVWTLFHSASFDFSVWEMWGCLLTGAHLVVVPRQIARQPYDFYELLIEKKVTILNQTPSAFYALQKVDGEQKNAKLSSVRLVIFGGEALDTYKISNWLERYPVGSCRLVNMYGITETTVHVTYRNIFQRDPEFLAKSVGVALPGWEISIRDTNTIPCLYGVEGEIWVGGAGVSAGYLHREELTRQRFVIDPTDGRTWYRSGDLGRMRPDGSVDYLGRMDSQVKIRGFRIELDEIRSVIQKIPNVRNVAVVLRDGEEGQSAQKQIVAFIESSEQVNPEQVRNYLKSKIPEYMIPARMIKVDEMKMTINGKIDYGFLLAQMDRPEQHSPGPADSGATDMAKDSYLALWSKIIGHPIAPEDNFFDVGGNSLLAVELLSVLKKQVDDSLTLRDLYIHSSPKDLKDFLSNKLVEQGIRS